VEVLLNTKCHQFEAKMLRQNIFISDNLKAQLDVEDFIILLHIDSTFDFLNVLLGLLDQFSLSDGLPCHEIDFSLDNLGMANLVVFDGKLDLCAWLEG